MVFSVSENSSQPDASVGSTTLVQPRGVGRRPAPRPQPEDAVRFRPLSVAVSGADVASDTGGDIGTTMRDGEASKGRQPPALIIRQRQVQLRQDGLRLHESDGITAHQDSITPTVLELENESKHTVLHPVFVVQQNHVAMASSCSLAEDAAGLCLIRLRKLRKRSSAAMLLSSQSKGNARPNDSYVLKRHRTSVTVGQQTQACLLRQMQ
jgi:hypothetical protein